MTEITIILKTIYKRSFNSLLKKLIKNNRITNENTPLMKIVTQHIHWTLLTWIEMKYVS
jgi:hypothetical protein